MAEQWSCFQWFISPIGWACEAALPMAVQPLLGFHVPKSPIGLGNFQLGFCHFQPNQGIHASKFPKDNQLVPIMASPIPSRFDSFLKFLLST